MSAREPDLVVESELLASGWARVGAVDEVGRGCIAGCAAVGIVVVDSDVREVPDGVRDSKLLTAGKRAGLVQTIRDWSVASAVGFSTAAEVDEWGILPALRLAGQRAIAQLGVGVDGILLDGSYDWLSGEGTDVPVVTKVKADLACASVAAASVLAKVERDALMDELAEQWPGYGWESNRGYGTKAHYEALARLGPSSEHRRSFNLDGTRPSTRSRRKPATSAGGTQPADK